MRVDVRLFASYREAAGVSRLDLDLPAGSTVGDALAAIAERHPRIAGGARVLTARNREYVAADVALADGDELALIPPVSGGSGGSGERTDLAGRRTAQPGPSRSGAPEDRIRVTAAALSLDAVVDAVRADAHGGIVVFIGTVRERSRGQRVTRLDYEAYAEMAEAKMREIAARLEATHGARVAMHHRVGELSVGEIAVIVAAAAPHRDAAFAASRGAIDELKTIVPIWKKEHTEDGAVWIDEHA